MEILEKVAYLKGLAEGLALDKESKEGKLIGVIIDLLDDMALEMQDLRDEQCEIEEGLDAVSDGPLRRHLPQLRGGAHLRRGDPGRGRRHLPRLRRAAGPGRQRPPLRLLRLLRQLRRGGVTQ